MAVCHASIDGLDALAVEARDSRPALEELAGRCVGLIRRWAGKRFSPRYAADHYETAVSIGLAMIPEVVRHYDPGQKQFGKYLYICVVRRWNREMVKMFARRELGLTDAGVLVDHNPRLAQVSRRMEVEEILEKMDKKSAALLKMVYGIGVERVAVSEIARGHGASRSTQQDRVDAALRDFRSRWEGPNV